MEYLKMTGEFYDDVKRVGDAISYLHGMIDFLERERIEMDKGKTATGIFIRINSMKQETEKMVHETEQLLRESDIERYGPLSVYVRPYLAK